MKFSNILKLTFFTIIYSIFNGNLAKAKDSSAIPFNVEPNGLVTIGNPDAKVTMYEFFAMDCPSCATFSLNTFSKIQKNYIETGKLKVIFIGRPLTSVNIFAHKILTTAPNAEVYLTLMHNLYKNQIKWSRKPNINIIVSNDAKLLGIDEKQIKTLDKNKSVDAEINKLAEEYFKIVGLKAFPTSIFIKSGESLSAASHKFEGVVAYERIKPTIESLLK